MKLKNKGLLYLSLGVSFLAVSCANEAPWGSSSSTDGWIELNVVTDNSVTMGTRADDTDYYALTPDVDKFSVNLKSTDGSYNKTWETLTAFRNEKGFPMGNYVISAFYGGENLEGFELPYYYAETSVQVRLGETSAQNLEVKLCNAMLSIEYADALRSNYKAYSSTVKTENNTISYAFNEKRPAYLNPGKVEYFLSLTNINDEQVNLNLATLNLTARHHYILKVGVNEGERGGQTLSVEVTEEIIEGEKVQISLSDELFSQPAPTVEAIGFENGKTINMIESFLDEDFNPEFHVIALGGLASAELTLTADKSIPVVGGTSYTFQLMNIDEIEKSKLDQTKINSYGFYTNPDKMGVVNLKEYLKLLPKGSYTASMIVKDVNTKTSPLTNEEGLVTLSADVEALKYEISGYNTPEFLSNEIVICVSSNTNLINNNLQFFATDSNRSLTSTTAEAIEAGNGTPKPETSLPYTYIYKLSTAEINDVEWSVGIQSGLKDRIVEVLPVKIPDFEVLTDPFAKRVKLKFSGVSSDLATKLVHHVNVKNNGEKVKDDNLDRSQASQGILIVKGLNSKGSTVSSLTQTFDGVYSDMIVYFGTKEPSDDYPGKTVPSFTTEEERDVPNGNFNEQGKRIYFSDIQAGGQWNVPGSPGVRYTNYGTINRYEPQGWTTLNSLTCYAGSSPQNTWFMVPSTYMDNGEVVICSVGYNHQGKVPAQSQKIGQGVGNGFCTNAPAEGDFVKVAGELFLGKYDYNSVTREDGIAFTTRPSYISFNYNYVPQNGEEAVINIALLDGNKRELSKKEILLPGGSGNDYKLYLPDTFEFGVKAQYITVNFKSSNANKPAIYIPEDEELKVSHSAKGVFNIYDRIISGENNYKAMATGSELRISNVKLGYE